MRPVALVPVFLCFLSLGAAVFFSFLPTNNLNNAFDQQNMSINRTCQIHISFLNVGAPIRCVVTCIPLSFSDGWRWFYFLAYRSKTQIMPSINKTCQIHISNFRVHYFGRLLPKDQLELSDLGRYPSRMYL